MDEDMLNSYRAYVASQCSYYAPGNDKFLSGEIISQWFNRKSLQREMSGQQAELARIDGVLSGLLYEQKQRLSCQGRNGGWSRWLKENNISRATADRLVMEHVEFFGLQNELPQRERPEPLEGNISQAAYRTSDRMEGMLKSPRSRLIFLSCLADRFGLIVDFGIDGSLLLSTSLPVSEVACRVPNVIQMASDGSVIPVNYELKDGDGADSTTEHPPNSDNIL